MVSPPDSRRRMDRARIERALLDEVVENGYSAATVDGVCARAGAEREDFNLYFTDLQDGYCQLLEALDAEIFEQLLAAFDGQETWCDQVRAAAYAIFDFFDEDRWRGRFMMVEGFFAGERAQQIRDRSLGMLVELVDQGRQQLDDPEQLSRATAEAIAGSTFHQIRCALEHEDTAPGDLLPQLMYSVIQPYLGVEKACRELEAARRRHASKDVAR
jgi:AcrR family transcriptional regulator